MKTRNLILWAIPALMLAGCQNEMETAGQMDAGEEATIRISVEAPEAMSTTRAALTGSNSARGGITNVDWTKYDLRYQIAVYSADGSTQVVAPITKTVQKAYSSTTFDIRLVDNREYKFVAWADFVTTGTEGTEGYPADLHYNTADLTNITCKDAVSAQLNDESRDAYFVTINQTVDADAGVSLTLKRPFAKVRVVSTDWQPEGINMPDNFKITYYGCKRFTGLNAVTGAALGGDTDLADKGDSSLPVYTATFTSKTDRDYAEGYEKESPNNRTLTVDYLWAKPEQTSIHFTLEALDAANPVDSYDFITEIPIRRNYLTTLLGNFLTDNTKMTVSCDENFENQENPEDAPWYGEFEQ